MAIDPAILGRYFGGVGPAPVAPPPPTPTVSPSLTKAQLTTAMNANAVKSKADLSAAASSITAVSEQAKIVNANSPVNETAIAQAEVANAAGVALEQPGGAVNQALGTSWTPMATSSTGGNADQRSDAFAALIDLFTSYGLGDLSGTITDLMTAGESSSGALVKLKYSKEINPKTQLPYNAAYTARFAGNASRVSKGLNALTEAQYISNEDAYAETLRAYGLGNMLSTDRTANQKKFADYIANDVSSTEFANRIKTASDSVINADPQVMKTFQQYYGGLTTSDLVSYFLAPDETLPMLQQKVSASEIGTAAQEQGLGTTDKARSEYLAKMGVNQAGGMSAISGYQNIADVLPTGQKLSSIYKEAGINYDQTTAENEYLLQNANAATKRKQLASLERAKFSGDAGINPQASNLASARTVQGKF